MATGTTLLNLRKKLRLETGGVASETQAKAVKDAHNNLLDRVQEWLHDDHDWPQLVTRTDIALVAGTKLYTISSPISIQGIRSIHTKYAGTWAPLLSGISPEHYAVYDSDEDQRHTPATRYRQHSATEIEVWPIPSTAGVVATKENYLRVEAVLDYVPITEDAHPCLLDDQLIVLYAAAEILGRKKDPDAQNKLALARKRRLTLVGKSSKTDTFSLFAPSGKTGTKRGGLNVVYAR
ncbi:MAG: hypothetical protein JKY94_00945 [Rhodobacteraceae bacterium]|nr:hypothetical protein [Paracoccaceae bacterium]